MRNALFAFTLFCLSISCAQAFNLKHKRTLSGQDVFRVYRQKFPSVFKIEYVTTAPTDSNCRSLSASMADIYGLPRPTNGKSLFTAPGPLFVAAHGTCAENLVHADLYIARTLEANGKIHYLHRHFGKSALQKIEPALKGMRLRNLIHDEVQKEYYARFWTGPAQLMVLFRKVTTGTALADQEARELKYALDGAATRENDKKIMAAYKAAGAALDADAQSSVAQKKAVSLLQPAVDKLEELMKKKLAKTKDPGIPSSEDLLLADGLMISVDTVSPIIKEEFARAALEYILGYDYYDSADQQKLRIDQLIEVGFPRFDTQPLNLSKAYEKMLVATMLLPEFLTY